MLCIAHYIHSQVIKEIMQINDDKLAKKSQFPLYIYIGNTYVTFLQVRSNRYDTVLNADK